MKEFNFTILLPEEFHELTEQLESAFFECGCDDALLGKYGGRIVLDFSREANSQEEAVISAYDCVKSAIKHIDPNSRTLLGWVNKADDQLCPS